MKCPKCEYLGFETGDRCRNCGYDFSLMAAADPLPDLDLQLHGDRGPMVDVSSDAWLREIDRDLATLDLPEPDIEPIEPVPPAAVAPVAAVQAEPPVPVTRPPVSRETVSAEPASAVPVSPAPIATPPINAAPSDAASISAASISTASSAASISTSPVSAPPASTPPASTPPASTPPASTASPVTSPEPRYTPSSLPLFTGGDDDTPLVKLPATPRAPLSVRRTPEHPRLRSLSRAIRKEPEPVLQFDEALAEPEPLPQPRAIAPAADAAGSPSARLIAAVVDHAILGAIDLTVLYFTLKIAALSTSDWPLIPMVPMVAFLLMLKLMYFAAFTAVGGQTIGKMGSGLRVVAEDGSPLDPTRALRRSLAGMLSLATLGAGFLPAILGEDRRAIHDRVAGTRVVAA